RFWKLMLFTCNLTMLTGVSAAFTVAHSAFAVEAQHVTAASAAKLIEKHRSSKDLVVLDVRTADEFAEDHIGGAQQLDFYAKDFKDQLAKLDKSKAYLLYCRSGGRSGKAAAMMTELGFSRVSEISGGMISWEKAKLPVVSGN
ncbi:MAG: hypothetical protein RL011_927, partial [Pseudomonadota bacterium]